MRQLNSSTFEKKLIETEKKFVKKVLSFPVIEVPAENVECLVTNRNTSRVEIKLFDVSNTLYISLLKKLEFQRKSAHETCFI
jgi:hypothetical protein